MPGSCVEGLHDATSPCTETARRPVAMQKTACCHADGLCSATNHGLECGSEHEVGVQVDCMVPGHREEELCNCTTLRRYVDGLCGAGSPCRRTSYASLPCRVIVQRHQPQA